MAKKSTKPASAEPKPIVINVTIYPPKHDKRRVIVSAAPEGEMPLLLSGLFQERHVLLDRAYGEVLKRDPQIVTVKEEKSANKANRAPKTEAQEADEAEEAEQTDQLVEAAEAHPSTAAANSAASAQDAGENLPAIEGDDVETLPATSVQDISDISDAVGSPTKALGDDVGEAEVGDGE